MQTHSLLPRVTETDTYISDLQAHAIEFRDRLSKGMNFCSLACVNCVHLKLNLHMLCFYY